MLLRSSGAVTSSLVAVPQYLTACPLIAMQVSPTGIRAGPFQKNSGAVHIETGVAKWSPYRVHSRMIARLACPTGMLGGREGKNFGAVLRKTLAVLWLRQLRFDTTEMLATPIGRLAGCLERRHGAATMSRKAAATNEQSLPRLSR